MSTWSLISDAQDSHTALSLIVMTLSDKNKQQLSNMRSLSCSFLSTDPVLLIATNTGPVQLGTACVMRSIIYLEFVKY